jgi:hypothetical protein
MTPPTAAEPTSLGFESRRPYVDPVIEAYKKDVDRTLIRAMLRLTPEQRLLNLERVVGDIVAMRNAVAEAAERNGR